MEVTREMVKQTAELARLELNEAEEVRMQADLQQILSYMECLEDTGLHADAGRTVTTDQLRPDEVQPSMPVEELLAVSPSQRGFWTPEEG